MLFLRTGQCETKRTRGLETSDGFMDSKIRTEIKLNTLTKSGIRNNFVNLLKLSFTLPEMEFFLVFQ